MVNEKVAPRPWTAEPFVGEPDRIWIGNRDGYIAEIRREDGLTDDDWADAGLIVRAVNAHDHLVETLLHIERACEPGLDRSDDELEAFIANVRGLAKAAIAKVRA